jgi:nucleoside 2-deoxyribosyltransferase
MSVLTGKQCYLAGPIENASDPNALNWRIEPRKILREKFGINLFDPTEDPKQQWAASLHKAREEKDYNKMVRIAKSFVQKDLATIDKSDFIIAYLPYRTPTTGTIHEIIHSDDVKKPVILICPQGKEFLPLWFYGFIDQNTMFGSWNDLYFYLEEVNNGKHISNRRWNLVYGLV